MPYTGQQKRDYQRIWLRNRRQRALKYLGGVCVMCGTDENLEFDHRDRALKTSGVSQLLSRQWDHVVLELDKCQLLCVKHHKEKTLAEMPGWKGIAEHGTHSKYSSGCRCASCKAGHANLARAWRRVGKNW